MRCTSAILAALLLTGAAHPASGQEIVVTWHGDPPRQGSFAYVLLDGTPAPVVVRGTIDSLPLAFESLSGGRHVALAPVPLGAPDSMTVRLRLDYAKGRVRMIVRRLPTRPGRFPTERLSVDPRFTRPPDAALQARIAREAAAARRVTAEALGTPRLWQAAFVAPRDSRVTSVFGIGRVFNRELRSRHLGTDFQGAVGDPVRATNRGVVALVGDFYYAGRVVYVNHGAGLISAYLHLSRVDVSAGDTVGAGQIIGGVGQSGRVTGPHLHWSIRVGTSSLDGTSLLALPPLERLFEE